MTAKKKSPRKRKPSKRGKLVMYEENAVDMTRPTSGEIIPLRDAGVDVQLGGGMVGRFDRVAEPVKFAFEKPPKRSVLARFIDFLTKQR
jgi:hypothetical protein